MALATLSIDLVAKIAKFEEDMGKAARAAEEQAARIDKVFSGVKKAIAGLGIAAIVTDQINGVKAAIDKLDALDDLSEKYGVAASKLSGYSYASEVAGTSTEAFAAGLSKLSKNMALAAGGSVAQATAFKAVGVAVTDANGNLRSADAVLLDLADRFSGYEDGAAKAALAQAIFGKSGADLIPVLNKGSQGIKDLTDEARQFGLIVDDKAAKAAGDFNDNIKRLQLSAEALKIAIASELLPTLVRFTNELIEGKKAFGGWLAAAEQLGLKTSPFATYEESAAAASRRIGELREAIQNVQDRARRGRSTDADRQFVDLTNAEIEVQEKRLKYFRRMNDLTSEVPEGLKDTRGGVGGKTAAPIIDSKPERADKTDRIEHAYAKLIESIKTRGALVQAELENNSKLDESDRFRIEQLAKLNAAENKFTDPQKAAGAAEVERVSKLIEQVEVRKELRAAADADAASEQASIATIEAVIEARLGENRALSDQVALYGRTAEEIERAAIARLQDALAVEQWDMAEKKANGAGPGALELMRNKIALLEKQIALRGQLLGLTERDQNDPGAGLANGLKDYLRTIDKAGETVRSSTSRGLATLEDDLVNSVISKKPSVKNFIDFVIAEFTRLQIVRPLMKNLLGSGEGGDTGWLGTAAKAVGAWFKGLSGSAKGDIFDMANSKPFAKGGVFDSPQFFRFANGGAMANGVLGEAGPEAVVPLRRDSRGRLGIASSGGGGGMTFAPTFSTHIDARTDADDVQRLVLEANQQSQRQMYEQLRVMGVIR